MYVDDLIDTHSTSDSSDKLKPCRDLGRTLGFARFLLVCCTGSLSWSSWVVVAERVGLISSEITIQSH
jgi:hypothetical protein